MSNLDRGDVGDGFDGDGFDREERAFADALRGALAGEEFGPLDPARIAAEARRQPRVGRPWLKGLAAAASVVLVVGAGATILPRMVGASGSAASRSDAAGAPSQQADQETAMGGPTAAASGASRWATTAASPLSPRMRASVTWLDGRYYVVGGVDAVACGQGSACAAAGNLSDGAAYDPSVDAWTPIADAPHALATAADGRTGSGVAVGDRLYFLAADGSFVCYDPSADAWTTLPSGGRDGTLVAADDRVVEVANRRAAAGTEIDRIFDPGTGAWTMLPADPLPVAASRTAAVAGNRLVLSADSGDRDQPVAHVAVLDLDALSWQVLLPRSGLDGTRLTAVGEVVVWPRTGSSGGILDPVTATWTQLPGLPEGTKQGGGFEGVVAAGRVGVDHHLLDPATGSWTPIPDAGAGTTRGRSLAGGSNGLFLFGGWTGKAYTSRALYLSVG